MDGHDFAMAGRILQTDYVVVTFADDDTIFDDDGTEWSAISCIDADFSFVDGHLHEFVHLLAEVLSPFIINGFFLAALFLELGEEIFLGPAEFGWGLNLDMDIHIAWLLGT